MNLADVSIADIIIFIFKVFIAIVIIAWIIGMIGGFAKFLADIGKLFQSILSDLFPIIFNSLGSVFNSIWRHLIKIGFRNSFWNLVPLLWVFIEIFTAILSLLFSRPNSTNFWPWWKYALPGVIVFGATLAINIMIGKYLANRGMSSKLENNSCDNFTIEEMPIEDHDIGHNEESNPLSDYSKPLKSGHLIVASSKSKIIQDCKNNRYKVGDFMDYDGHKGTGNIVNVAMVTETNWYKGGEGSVNEVMKNLVCKQ